MKLRYIVASIVGMGLLIPFKEVLAASRWTYMLGHASALHFLVNMCSWLLMWRIATPGRLLMAYLLSVACASLPSSQPVIGWSVVLFFFLGMMLRRMDRGRRMRLLFCLLISFFLPHMAALHHGVMLILGYIYIKVEGLWARTL
jgi:hypothetical protein